MLQAWRAARACKHTQRVGVEFNFLWTFNSEAQARDAAQRLREHDLTVIVARGDGEGTIWQTRAMTTSDPFRLSLPASADREWMESYMQGRFDALAEQYDRLLRGLDANYMGGGVSWEEPPLAPAGP